MHAEPTPLVYMVKEQGQQFQYLADTNLLNWMEGGSFASLIGRQATLWVCGGLGGTACNSLRYSSPSKRLVLRESVMAQWSGLQGRGWYCEEGEGG